MLDAISGLARQSRSTATLHEDSDEAIHAECRIVTPAANVEDYAFRAAGWPKRTQAARFEAEKITIRLVDTAIANGDES
jgi:hypothetical protein